MTSRTLTFGLLEGPRSSNRDTPMPTMIPYCNINTMH